MTAYYLRISDWSSDVCSSDLTVARRLLDEIPPALRAEAWLERIEQYVAALAPEDRAALRDGVHGGLKVVTASALPDAARADWQRRLRAALDGAADHVLTIDFAVDPALIAGRSEEHTSELQSLMRISYAVFCLKKK